MGRIISHHFYRVQRAHCSELRPILSAEPSENAAPPRPPIIMWFQSTYYANLRVISHVVDFKSWINGPCLSAWFRVEVCFVDPLPGGGVTHGSSSWVRSAATPPPLSVSLLPSLFALIIPRPIYPHLLMLTVGMKRATNSTGSFNEGRSNLEVGTQHLFARLLVQTLVGVTEGREKNYIFSHVFS